ncbi:MAG TPA: LPS export ABC transporter permease LptF, partial [Candidatus Acidoferrum sp.]|nr:LPS export ABC transporter permease LptF [Candidatus Acidoferrum sp.]
MRLLDRYITREVASHAILGLAVFTFVFFVPQLVRLMDLIVRHSGGAWTVARLFLCSLPPVLTFTLPMAVLVGVLIGLGRLSADSEIVALHACGISLRRLLLPVGFVAAASTLVTLVMTFWLSPLAVRTLRSLEDELRSSQAPFAVQPRVFDERFPRFVLYVQDVEAAATHWRGVFLAASGGQAGSTVTVARDATIVQGENSPDRSEIELHLGAGSTHEYDPRDLARYNVTTFGESAIPIDISAAPGAAPSPKSAAASMAELSTLLLIRTHGPNWRDARVELHRRIAFPAACLVFALLGVPVGVRPRRGGRATGLILTLILIGGYYFLFVTGAHMAQQGSVSPWLGIWIANIVALVIGLYLLGLIESVRKPNLLVAWVESQWSRFRQNQRRESEAAPMPVPNGVLANGSTPNGPVRKGLASRETNVAPSRSVSEARRVAGAGTAAGFPMLVDFYLLQTFFYYFGVLLAGFVVIFDAFTLFDMLGDISKNHIPVSMVVEFFRYLVPYFVYQLAPLATLVATLVTLAILAKNNEVIAFKASGISLYRIVLPLTFAGCLIAGGMFLLDDTYLPYASQRQDALRNQIKGRPAQTYFQPARQWIMGEDNKIYNYELFDFDRQLFGGLNVFELDPATFQIRRRVFATRATWEP